MTDEDMTREDWAERPYIDYLNAVDELLEARRGFTSTETELDTVTTCQEELMTPEECMDAIMREGTT